MDWEWESPKEVRSAGGAPGHQLPLAPFLVAILETDVATGGDLPVQMGADVGISDAVLLVAARNAGETKRAPVLNRRVCLQDAVRRPHLICHSNPIGFDGF